MTIPSDQKQIYLNTEMASRLAGIDIGSNSVRLLVAEVFRGSSYRILDEEREPTRLARSISSDGELDKEAMARTLEALATFKQIAAGYQVSALRTIATCAVREATNGSEFCQRIQKEVGLSVEIISGEREARLAFSSVQHAFDLNGKNIVIADIGGGSTEIVFATGSLVESIFSTPLGAVRLTERCGIGSGVDGIEFQRGLIKLNKEINGCLKRETSRPLFAPHFLVGSGGTFTTLAELVMASKKEADIPVAGYKVSHAELRHLLDQLKKCRFDHANQWQACPLTGLISLSPDSRLLTVFSNDFGSIRSLYTLEEFETGSFARWWMSISAVRQMILTKVNEQLND